MNANWTTSSPTRRRPARGATLIEVLGGLALLASLLVAILVAQAGYTRQSATAERRLRAVAAADRLLQNWWREPERFPVAQAGTVASDDAFTWRTRLVSANGLENFEAQVVRLEILDGFNSAPLASVDVVLPKVVPQ